MSELLQSTFTKFQLTENNPFDLERKMNKETYLNCIVNHFDPEYFCYSEEIGEEGNFHIHVYVKCRFSKRFSTIKRVFPHAHIERARGSSSENRDYIFKQGKWANSEKNLTNDVNSHFEYGVCPPDEADKQGRRNDLVDLYEGVLNGMSNTDIVRYNPKLVTRLKDMDALRTAFLYEENRKKLRHLEVIYISGETGVGKSRYVLEKHGFENVYRVTDYKHPFDSYQAEDIIIFEEFRNSLKIEQMLNYLDIYPLSLPCRYNNKQACYTKVFILSNWDYYEQYKDIKEKYRPTYDAWARRIHKVYRLEKGGVLKTIKDNTRLDQIKLELPFPTTQDDDLPY